MSSGRVVVLTGAMAAGKSTVADLLAARFVRGAHVRGDLFRRMVVGGRAEMSVRPSAEARRQLDLRYDLAARTADGYADAGFDVVVQDVILGDDLPRFVARVRTRPCSVVVLAPAPHALHRREEGRAKNGYGGFTPEDLDRVLREDTPRLGYWLDSTGQTPQETAEEVLAHLGDAEIRDHPAPRTPDQAGTRCSHRSTTT